MGVPVGTGSVCLQVKIYFALSVILYYLWENYLFMNYASALKRLREERKLEQEVAAAKAGISQSYLSRLESGSKKDPSKEILKKLCKVYGIDPVILVWYAVEPSDIPKKTKHLYEPLKPVMDALISEVMSKK